MPDALAQARFDLAVANRIVAHEGVLDALGHVSMRHPHDPNRYLLSRSRSPELVEPADICEFTLDSEPVTPSGLRYYSERVIHGCIYAARPDVQAICHHHAHAIMPFVATGARFVPVFHVGATAGAEVPYWDSRDDFGDTNLLVVKQEEGESLARALGKHWMVLMMHHGATLAGRSLPELVFRTVFSTRNAEYQLRATALGELVPMTPGEMEMAGEANLAPGPLERAWEYWVARLTKAGGAPVR
jgi:HCOMODA/2-hydroxy-3-carboxy-muconic semialdehyde decarboxylase